jgi:eukaryotic-like serine/threonine-protein kinase
MTERDIFVAALDLPPGPRRDAFLEEHCGTDTGLRLRLAALLAAHAKAEHFLEHPADQPTADDPARADESREYVPTELLGVTIAGKYKLREKLGEGGMGKVYVAERKDEIKQLVAVKLIRPGLESRAIQARFDQERQALAVMDHPNIARFFDGGVTEWGQPFFVMELIKGVPITKYCDQEKLTVHERLKLFVPVCAAVQHAHQKGIIHRDIKPSNILVALYDGKPVPKVIDFGVAKAVNQTFTDQSIYTGIKTIVGTLEYMAPEQAELNNLDIDTRADIYALGVTLYELLVGTVPFSRKDFEAAILPEMLRMIREVEPPKPSTKLSNSDSLPSVAATRKMEPRKLTKMLSGDLDWIIMKCLEKERARRYATANALALDLEHYLADEPVSAGPPSAWYRVRKFTKRHRGKVLVGSLLGAALLAGAAGTTWNMFRALQAERDAEVEAATARAVQSFLENDVLMQVSPEDQARAQFLVDKDIKLRTALDRAAESIKKGRFANQPLVLASLEMTIGKAYVALGLFEKAKPHLDRSYELRKQHLGALDLESLRSALEIARYQTLTTEYKPAEARLRQLVAEADKSNSPEEFKEECKLAWAHSFMHLSDYGSALKLYEEVRDARRLRYSEDDRRTLIVAQRVGNTYRLQGEMQKAEEVLLQVLNKQRRVLGNEDPDTLYTIQKLESLYQARQEFSKAEPLVTELVTTGTRIFQEDHPMLLVFLNDQASLFSRQGRVADSIGVFKKLHDLATKRFGESNDMTLAYAMNLASCQVIENQFQDAEALFVKLRPVVEKKHGTDSRQTRRILRSLATICEKTKRLPEADRYFTELLDNTKSSKSVPRHELFIEFLNAAESKLALKKLEDLHRLLSEAEPIRSGPNLLPYQLVRFFRLKGELALLQNKPQDAKKALLEADVILQDDRSKNPKRYQEDNFAKEEHAAVKQSLQRWVSKHGTDEAIANRIKQGY